MMVVSREQLIGTVVKFVEKSMGKFRIKPCSDPPEESAWFQFETVQKTPSSVLQEDAVQKIPSSILQEGSWRAKKTPSEDTVKRSSRRRRSEDTFKYPSSSWRAKKKRLKTGSGN